MINGMSASILGAVFYAAAAFLGVLLGSAFAQRITPFDDGPPQENVPVLTLIIACGVLGAIIAPRAPVSQLLSIAMVCVSLVAIWVSDARRGIVPDAFTLGPLAIVLTLALLQHQWWLLISAAVPFVPFAIAALLSRGRGMGWGDVKLAALGGAVLGAQLSVFAFMLACLAAAVLNYARGRKRGAIAFAPYMVCAIGIFIPLALRG